MPAGPPEACTSPYEPEVRLWTPALSVLEADAEYLGLAEHIGQLEVIHTLEPDYPVPPGIGAAVHAVRHLPDRGADALVATVAAEAYGGRGVPLLDLTR